MSSSQEDLSKMSVKVLVIYITLKKKFTASYHGLISNVNSNMLLFSFEGPEKNTFSS